MNMLFERHANGLRWVIRLVLVSLVLPMSVLAQGGPPVPGQPPLQFQPQVLQQIKAMQTEKASWTLIQQKISSKLLLATKRRVGQQLVAGLPTLRKTIIEDQAGLVLIDIKATVTDALLARIVALGGKVVNSYSHFNAIRARIPLAQVQTLAAEAAVRSIRPADRYITRVTSQGDVAHKADQARSTFGVDGTGVKIGVLSDSVDSLADLQADGELPAVTVLPGQSGNPGTSEGTAMLEIVHDLAPGAELFFATAGNSEAAFAQNILDLRAAGCDVIVDDIGFVTESTFQDGIIAQAVETVVADGAVYFSAAGNEGNLNDGTSGVWEGDFAPIGAPSVIGGTAHDFGGGTNANTITADSPFFFILQWSDPSGGSGNDYDLFLLDPTLSFILDASTCTQDGDDDPIEGIDSFFFNDTGNKLVVILLQGAADRYLHLNTLRGQLSIATAGQTSGHASAVSAFGVAAVSAFTGGIFNGSESVETFSSDGPRRIFYEADGTPITPGDFTSTGGTIRQKPDLAAADGVSTATPGFAPFFGTSAAAPHAAAIAGLLKSQDNTLTPAQIRAILNCNALDIEATGFDRDSGVGIIDALASLGAIGGLCSAPTAVCQNVTRSLTGNMVTVTAAEIDIGSSAGSSCVITSLEIKKAIGGVFGPDVTFGCDDLGPNDVTIRVTQDDCQISECIAMIIIEGMDTDGDGTSNCTDLCPNDPNKIDPGLCGCGASDTNTDSDGDGVVDCVDGCPDDPNKSDPGVCGCGTPDTGADISLDCNGNGVPDSCDLDNLTSIDCNANGMPDECDLTSGRSEDCNANGILDECDPDALVALPGSLRTIPMGETTILGDSIPPAAGGIPPYAFVWTLRGSKGEALSNDPNPVFDPVNPGIFTARMVVTDSAGCQSIAFVTIKVTGDQAQFGAGNPTTNTTSSPDPNQVGLGLCAPMGGMTLMAMLVGTLTLRKISTRRRRMSSRHCLR